MSELSIFIDESGDFGETRDVRDYYLVTFVFYDQNKIYPLKSTYLRKVFVAELWHRVYPHRAISWLFVFQTETDSGTL